ncbi:MAG: hypothetical protein OXK80_00780 [Bdellovibrionales bacterium]|nr:hypothetical protein [Bdellovibrionales bacterium]
MKLITLIIFTLMFIGCSSQETPPGAGDLEDPNAPPMTPPPAVESVPSAELTAGVSSQTILTCSKEGADDIVYVAKTYQTPKGCEHPKGEGKLCLCEVSSEDSFFDNRNGIYLYATSTGDWCEGGALDSIENNRGVTVYGTGIETEFVGAAHDESYTCSRS